MTRTKLARKSWLTPNSNHAGPLAYTPRDGHRTIVGIAAILLVLGWTAVCTAESGPGIGIKAGVQTLEDPVDLGKTTQGRLELEVVSSRLLDEHVDFALAFGGSYLGSYTDTYTDVVDGILRDDVYTDKLWLFDIRLAARLYPFGDHSRIQPYVGAGVGYFWFLNQWHDDYSDTFEDPLYADTFLTVTEEAEGRDTLAHGFFPFVLAGVTVPVGSHFELMAEFQYDFAKKDSGFDLGGPIYMLGARFRF